MEFTGGWFLVLMCVMGGLIAAVADVLGRNIGKKKHSILKLRPRHTATLFTAAAGIFIPLLTIGVLMLVSTDVRRMLQEGGRAVENLRKVQGELRVSKARLDQQKLEVDRMNVERRRIEGEMNSLSNRSASLTKSNHDLKSQNLTVKQSLTLSRRQLQDSRSKAAKAQSDLKSIRQRLDAIRAELVTNQGQLVSFEEQNRQAKIHLDEINGYSQKLLLEIQGLEKQQTELKGQVAGLQGQIEQLIAKTSAEAENYRQQIAKSKGELEGIQKDLSNAKDTLMATQSLARELERNLVEVRGRPLTFGVNEEVARWVAPAGGTIDESRRALNRLFSIASKAAESRGAVHQGQYDAASMFDVYDADGHLRTSVAAQEERIIKQLVGSPQPVLLVARSKINSFSEEFVRCTVEIYENKVVYHPGQVIAEGRIDGFKSDQEIADQLNEFMKDAVSPKAIKDGIVPVVGSPSPLGEVASGVVSQLIRDISAFRRTVRIQAISSGEVRRSDRLVLEFKLR